MRRGNRFVITVAVRWLASVIVVLAIGHPDNVAQNTPSPDLTASQLVQFLSHTIDWYRQTKQEQHIATEPSDLGFVADNRRLSAQIVKLAFDFARQEEQLLAQRSKSNSTAVPNAGGTQYESLSRAAADADQLVQETQAEVELMKQKLETVPSAKRGPLQIQMAETQSELGLFQARQQALHSMLEFASGATAAAGATSLRSQIEQLAQMVPAVRSGTSATENNPDQPTPTKAVDAVNKPSPSGIWALTSELFRLSSKRSLLSSELRATDTLERNSTQLRAPLGTHLKQLIQTGDQLAKEADTSDQSALAQEKQQLDALTAEFKQLSGVLSSLTKQIILLDLYKGSLSNWQAEVATEFNERIKGLLARILGLAMAFGAVFSIGEVWRRTIFRYVHDPRRRYQFLLIRKIVLWIAAALVLIFAFVTELGAVATFAGLITAGVAVALQNVIVSIVGYFFLIGKFGIRVGDRVQVGSVTGEVVEIGLVRFHLLELSGSAVDSEPTGRVVAFSNAVVFQSTSGLFKQIPGTDFNWHEIVLKFAPESDYPEIRDRVQKALDTAFADYRESLDLQRRQMEVSLTSVSAAELKPRARINFTTSAIGVTVRFPVVMDKAVEIDERIIREIFAAVNCDPKLKLINAEIPTANSGA